MQASFIETISLVKRLYDQSMQPACAAFSITRMELDILVFLANNPKYRTATDIIEHRRLTKSHVSSSLKVLAEKGFSTKYYEHQNRKTVYLKLTDKAEPIIRCGRDCQKEFTETIFCHFSTTEKEQFTKLSNKLIQNIQSSLTGGNDHAV